MVMGTHSETGIYSFEQWREGNKILENETNSEGIPIMMGLIRPKASLIRIKNQAFASARRTRPASDEIAS